jgi:hypothetical protein
LKPLRKTHPVQPDFQRNTGNCGKIGQLLGRFGQ